MFERLHLWFILSPLILSLAITVAIEAILKFLPERLPLFYSLPWGEGQLASYQQFLIIPASITAVTLINLAISWQLHPSQSFFKNALLLSSFIVSIILSVTFIKIVFLFV